MNCKVCGKNPVPEPEIIVNGGALQKTPEGAEWGKNLVGFFNISLHAHDNKKGCWIDIEKGAPFGQFEFGFCSIDCMRKYFNGLCDEMQKQIDNR
jgi:hypothetical protein